MDRGNAVYYETEMTGRGWKKLKEISDEILLQTKPAYDGASNKQFIVGKGALIFSKRYDSATDHVAIISNRATVLYYYRGNAYSVTSQTTVFPVVEVHSTATLFATAPDGATPEADKVLGPENKSAATAATAAPQTSATASSPVHSNRQPLSGDKLWESIREASGHGNKSSAFKLTPA